MNDARPRGRTRSAGATLVEAVLVLPLLLLMALAIIQAALLFYARSVLTYATVEAARAGALAHADPAAMRGAARRAMLVYYGGGRSAAEVAASALRAQIDLHPGTLRVQVLSPAGHSFDDYHSPQLQRQWGIVQRVIPNSALEELRCPRDRLDCDSNPQHNRSGQTLADANLLRLRVTYGVPAAKQVPVAGRLYVLALRRLWWDETDPFITGLLLSGRIPMVTHAVIRMQSDPFEYADSAAD